MLVASAAELSIAFAAQSVAAPGECTGEFLHTIPHVLTLRCRKGWHSLKEFFMVDQVYTSAEKREGTMCSMMLINRDSHYSLSWQEPL